MCKSKAEGGARCYSHTSKEYVAARNHAQEVRQELDRKHEIMGNIVQQQNALDQAYEDGNVYDEDYNRHSDVLIGHRQRGEKLIAEDVRKLAIAEDKAAKALAEVQTTHTGLKNLQMAIDQEPNPAKKAALQNAYNVGKRVGVRRAKAHKVYLENQETADALLRQAVEKKTEAENIVVSSDEHVRVRDDMMVEANLLRAKSHLARNNGNVEAQALIDAKTGNIVPAKLVDGKYGKVWSFPSDSGNSKSNTLVSPPRGKTYASRAAFWEKKGLRLGTVWVPGEAIVSEDDNGDKKVVLRRTDGGYSSHAKRGQDDVYVDKVKEEAELLRSKKTASAKSSA